MKMCPKCGKQYDDTWKICFRCSTDLVDGAGSSSAPSVAAGNTADTEDLQAELKSIRKDMSTLNQRINLVEYNLSQRQGKPLAERYTSIFKEPPKETTRPPEPPKREPVIQEKQIWKTEPEEKKSVVENFEQIVGGKLFHKMGILAVVVGVALLIGYSFKYLGPVGKIGIGYAFGLGMLLFGRFIEKKEDFSMYGKGLIGGAWAITYFTTFAMHHIPAVRLIANPFLGMVFLLCAAVAAVIDTYRYRSQVATGFSYLLIFITIMFSPVSLYSMAAIIPIALSLVFFMLKMNWYGFGLYGMIMTYLLFIGFTGWLNKGAQASGAAVMAREQFFIAWSFLLFYWGIFVAGTLLYSKKDEGRNIIKTREANHIVNTVLASLCGCVLVSAGFTQYTQPALLLGAGLYLVLTIVNYLMKKRPLYLIDSTISLVFLVSYLSMRFTGYTLTVSYLILAQMVLLAGIILKESYWRVLSFYSLAVILAKLLVIDSFFVKNSALAVHVSKRTVLFSVAFMIYLANHFIYAWLKKNDKLTELEESQATVISYGYPLIYAMGTWLDLPKVLTAPCWVILGVILLQIGIVKNNYHQRIQGYILCIGAFIRVLMSNMLIQGGISILSYRVLTSVPVLLLMYYCVMLLQDKKTSAVMRESERKMEFAFPYMVFIIIMLLVWYEAPKNFVGPIWGIVALTYSLRGIYSKKNYYLSISSIATIGAGMRAIFVNIIQPKYLVGAESAVIYPIFTIAVLFIGNIIYLKSKQPPEGAEGSEEGRIRSFFHSSKLVYGLAATILLVALLIVKLNGVLLTVSLGLAGMMLFLAGFGLKEKPWRIYGLIILLMTLAKIFLVDLRQLGTIYYIASLIVLGIALLFVSYIYTKHKDKIKKLI